MSRGKPADFGPAAPTGNRRTVKHGGAVTKKTHRAEIEAKERAIEDILAASAPVREHGQLPLADRPLVHVLAQQLVRHELMTEYVYEHGMFGDGGKVLPATELLEKSAMRIAHLLDRMGMSPTSRAKLGLDLARTADLAQAMSEPDPERRANLLRSAGVLPEGDDA